MYLYMCYNNLRKYDISYFFKANFLKPQQQFVIWKLLKLYIKLTLDSNDLS